MTATKTANPNISLNEEQRLYVLKCGEGYSCLGFDVVEGYIRQLLSRLGDASKATTPASGAIGSLERYEYYKDLLAVYGQIGDKKTWFDEGTPEPVARLLDRLREDRTRVRLFYGDPQTGRDALEEWDTIGVVGRTGGAMRSPLLVPDGEIGGTIISSRRLVKVQSLVSGRVLYQHPGYHLPDLLVCAAPESDKNAKAYPFTVNVNGETHARFRSYAKACSWVGFISGEHHEAH